MKKQYEVTFAKGTDKQVTYPVEANNKQDAKAAFCLMYVGEPAQALERLLTVVEVEPEEE